MSGHQCPFGCCGEMNDLNYYFMIFVLESNEYFIPVSITNEIKIAKKLIKLFVNKHERTSDACMMVD
jgi:hypothetical protein